MVGSSMVDTPVSGQSPVAVLDLLTESFVAHGLSWPALRPFRMNRPITQPSSCRCERNPAVCVPCEQRSFDLWQMW